MSKANPSKKENTAKSFAKVIIPIKSPITGAYSFSINIVPAHEVKDYITKQVSKQ